MNVANHPFMFDLKPKQDSQLEPAVIAYDLHSTYIRSENTAFAPI